MRILHLLASPFFSGPAESLAVLALEQRRLGHEVSVAVDRKRGQASAEELAVPRFETLGLLADLPLELSVKSTPAGLVRDLAQLRRLSADVVHAHFTHDHLLARVGCRRRTLVVRSIHAPRSLRRTTPTADAWTVPTDTLARSLLGQRVMVLPALVAREFVPATDRGALRRTLGLSSGPLVGMVSTFQPSRRHLLGLEAFSRVARQRPEAQLLLVGDGVLEKGLRAAVAAAGLRDQVRFVGYQRGLAFVEYLQALDELWVLGLGNDYAARCAAQARAVGCRVVAVDEGALCRLADVIVSPVADAIAGAALGAGRRAPWTDSSADVAARLVEFYRGSAR
jgi:glycosyltransferase involved in cell wall biosynthesis